MVLLQKNISVFAKRVQFFKLTVLWKHRETSEITRVTLFSFENMTLFVYESHTKSYINVKKMDSL